MLKKSLDTIIRRFGLWRSIHVLLGAGTIILFCTAAVRTSIPISIANFDSQANTASDVLTASSLSETLEAKSESSDELVKIFRPGLFKAATGLRDRPLANKTIERIKSQLTLKCVMEMRGQPVSYIDIKDFGLKKCSIGDSVSDLFTVLNINKQNKSVEISIVDHKVTLQL